MDTCEMLNLPRCPIFCHMFHRRTILPRNPQKIWPVTFWSPVGPTSCLHKKGKLIQGYQLDKSVLVQKECNRLSSRTANSYPDYIFLWIAPCACACLTPWWRPSHMSHRPKASGWDGPSRSAPWRARGIGNTCRSRGIDAASRACVPETRA